MLISSYLPSRVENNKSLEALGWDSDKIYSKTGIKQRCLSKEGEYANDMAIRAAAKLFRRCSKDEIDYLIHVTQSPDYIIPSNCCILQNALGLRKDIGAIDINMGCSGYIYALSVAKGLLISDDVKKVLITTSDTYSKIISPRDKSNRVIFGDAATATLVGQADLEKLGSFVFGTDGSGAERLICRRHGFRNQGQEFNEIVTDRSGNERRIGDLYMDGPAIFAFALEKVPQLVENVLRKNRIKKDDIDMYILHQANAFMLKALRDKMGISSERFMINVENTGNTVSSTIPIALEHYIHEKKRKGDENLLLAGFGVGFSWAGVHVRL